MRAALENDTRPTSGMRLPLAAGATGPHGGAQAIIQAHVNGCVRRTATYACVVKELHTPKLGRERAPRAAGCGTRPPVGRAWCDRRARRGSGKTTSTRKRMREAYSHFCVRRWGIAYGRTAGELAPWSAEQVRPACMAGIRQ